MRNQTESEIGGMVEQKSVCVCAKPEVSVYDLAVMLVERCLTVNTRNHCQTEFHRCPFTEYHQELFR